MPLAQRLVRPLRARDDDSASEPYSDELGGSSRSPSILSTGSAAEGRIQDSRSGSDDDEEDEEDEEEGDDVEEEEGSDASVDVKDQLAKVSFGALAKAQDALTKSDGDAGRKRKRGQPGSKEQEEKLRLLRERLQQLRDSKIGKSEKSSNEKNKPTKPNKTVKPTTPLVNVDEGASDSLEDDDSSDSSDPDSDDSNPEAQPTKRKSKHAPASQSSSRPVPRARAAIAVAKKQVRDPRFDKLSGRGPDATALAKKYAFLSEYRADEMAALKTAIKTGKAPDSGRRLADDDRERLRVELRTMEDRERESRRREREKEVLREHKRVEREAVREGKKPFFLKKSERKKMAVVDRFEGLKGKEKDKAIERRRKKVAAREKRNMPAPRRAV